MCCPAASFAEEVEETIEAKRKKASLSNGSLTVLLFWDFFFVFHCHNDIAMLETIFSNRAAFH